MLRDGRPVSMSREDVVRTIGDAEKMTLLCIPRNDKGEVVGDEYTLEVFLDGDRDLFNTLTSHMQMSLHLD